MKNRTQGINKWHRDGKDVALKTGQLYDAIKRRECGINEGMETALMEIENHAEIKRQAKLDLLEKSRMEKLSLFMDTTNLLIDLSGMDNDVWEAWIQKKELDFNIQKKETERIEAERLQQIEKEKLERARLKAENEKLKAENEKIEAARKLELAKLERARIKKEKIESDLRAAEAAKRQAIDEANKKAISQLEADKKRSEREAKAEIDAANAELLKVQQEKEEIIRQEESKRQLELSKGDAAKMQDLLSELEALTTKFDFKSKANKNLYVNVCLLLDKITNYILK
jgi:hypothetical protein